MDRTAIIAEAMSRITTEMLREQTDEQFCMLLESFGLIDLVSNHLPYFPDTQKNGKIILFGDTQIKVKDIHGCLKQLKIDKNRFEYVPYTDIRNYNFRNLEYNSNYSLILLGAMPHSARGMGDTNNALEWLNNNKNVAKTIRLENLKVTKTGLKKTLKEQIQIGYIETDWD